jgi:hypothetical protein
MATRLNTGDLLPTVTLELAGGGTLTLPEGLDARYRIAVFYRGHW